MFLKHRFSGDQLRVDDLETLFNPQKNAVEARDQAGQEEQDPQCYPKDELIFPSGETLPRCWCDPKYQLDKNVLPRELSQRG